MCALCAPCVPCCHATTGEAYQKPILVLVITCLRLSPSQTMLDCYGNHIARQAPTLPTAADAINPTSVCSLSFDFVMALLMITLARAMVVEKPDNNAQKNGG
jgi:hypothetical protein